MILQKLREIASRYDVYLVDQWGVLHNGVELFPDALEAMIGLKEQGKQVIILSNSSKPRLFTENFLSDLGFHRQYYDYLITSGSDFQDNIFMGQDEFYQKLGKKCYLLSWQQDMTLKDGKVQHAVLIDLPIEVVSNIDSADFILCAGVDRAQDLADYFELLEQAKMRNLPMICINPDQFSVNSMGIIEICPGAIAAVYEEKYQGIVRWHGKPYPWVYQTAARFAGQDVGKNFLAIGDSLHHDIKGIKDAGGDGLFITSGVAWQDLGLTHQYDDASATALQRLYDDFAIYPDYAQTRLVW